METIKDCKQCKQSEINLNKLINNFLNKDDISRRPTELQLHKSLFFLYGEYYKSYGEEIFQPDFQAWKYGPVEQNLRYGIKPIVFQFRGDTDEEVQWKRKNAIEYFLFLLNTDSRYLVNLAHENKTWIRANSTGEMWKSMSNKEIQDDFKE